MGCWKARGNLYQFSRKFGGSHKARYGWLNACLSAWRSYVCWIPVETEFYFQWPIHWDSDIFSLTSLMRWGIHFQRPFKWDRDLFLVTYAMRWGFIFVKPVHWDGSIFIDLSNGTGICFQWPGLPCWFYLKLTIYNWSCFHLLLICRYYSDMTSKFACSTWKVNVPRWEPKAECFPVRPRTPLA